jgi:outer membrane protein assembly factor BamB
MKDRSFRLLLTASAMFGVSWTSGLCADWFQYRGPEVDGTSRESIQCVVPAGGPKCLWRVPTPAGFSSFAVQGGKAFTLVTRDLDGAASEVCLALDANSDRKSVV